MDIQKKIEKYVDSMNESLVGEHKAQMYIDKLQQCISSFKKTLKAIKEDEHVAEMIVDIDRLSFEKANKLLDNLDTWVDDLEAEIFEA